MAIIHYRQSQLKLLHPDLYKRVRLKFLTFTALGLSLIFTPPLSTPSANKTQLYQYMPYWCWGAIFVAIALGIAAGIYSSPNRYRVARYFLYAAFVYALFWDFALLLTVFTGHPATSSILILWTYMTYNLYVISSDSGWEGVELLKQLRNNEEHRDNAL